MTVALPAVADMGAPLALYDRACQALAEAKAVDEVKAIHDVARQMAAAARVAKNRELEADAFEIRVRAERRLGEMIAAQKATVGLNVGGRPKTGSVAEPVSRLGTLAEAGIDKKLSARAQRFNTIPADQFEEMVAEGRREVLRNAERRTIKAVEIAEARSSYEARAESGSTVTDLHALIASGKRFAAILADPPWLFHAYSGKGKQRSAERHYDTMTLDEIAALPVGHLATKDCALFLWCVKQNLPGTLEVVKAWGFEYTTVAFFYVKTNQDGEGLHWGTGYWTRANVEPCILATRGSPTRLAMDVHEIIMAPVGEHSAKPAEVHSRIERLLAGPYLELFARRARPGWTVWGNEISRGGAVNPAGGGRRA